MFHRAILTMVGAFDASHIPYAIGGSVASSVRGVLRATNDVGFLAAISNAQTGTFVKALGSEFYADVDHIRESIGRGRAFNIIHMPTAFKIDVFPAVEEFHRAQLQRATTTRTFQFFDQEMTCRVVAPEDVVLAKLRWYRMGGESSERQWNDISGVVCVAKLNQDYLRNWAAKLGVSDLLERALQQKDD